MAEFLVELYMSREDGAGAARGADRAREAANELNREGTPIRYLRSIFVPEDETCFVFYEASSAEGVLEAARRASLPVERIAEAITESKGDGR